MENGKRNELEIDRTNSSRIQYLENDLWKMRIKMLSDLKNNETQLRDERLVEMKNLQVKINEKRIENCDYVHNLLENSWLSNFEYELKNLTQNKEIERSKSSTLVICNALEKELNEIKSVLEGLNLRTRQEEKIIELRNKINSAQISTNLWNEYMQNI